MTLSDPGLGLAEIPAAEGLTEDDLREPTKEEIMDDIRQGIREAKAGHDVPAREAIEAMRKRIYGDVDVIMGEHPRGEGDMRHTDPGLGLAELPAAEGLTEDDLREPTKEEIMDDIRQGIREAKAGEGMPALEALEAIRRRVYGDANDR